MDLKKDTYIIIAAYNESGKVKEVIRNLQDNGFLNIIVVEDGSKDNTYEVLREVKGIHLLRHIINRGQGAALQTGNTYAIKNGAKYIVHFDADGQHPVSQILELVEPLAAGKFDIIMGSRFKERNKNETMPFSKKIVLRVGILFTYLISAIMLTDTHNGFRGMTAEAAEKLTITMDRFEHASEIIDLINYHKLRYKEIQVKIEYSDYSKQKGQKMSNSINIAKNFFLKKLYDIFA